MTNPGVCEIICPRDRGVGPSGDVYWSEGRLAPGWN